MQPPTSVQDTDVQTNREKKPGEKKLFVCLQNNNSFLEENVVTADINVSFRFN